MPIVAIVGRPNVGKSTLFNRLAKKNLAIVEDVPGVTRDRHYAETEWGERHFTLVDTGGFVPDEKELLRREIREQAQLAVEESEAVLFVVDGRAGLSSSDEEIATYLRRSGKPVLLLVNKVDHSRQADAALADFHGLGLPEVFDVSAAHDRGLIPVVERLLELLPEPAPVAEEPDDRIRLAIVGRPNVGKSTLVNALIGKKRLITSDIAGTTRDPIDTELSFKGQRYVLTDTAGIRRKATIAQRVEQYAVMSAMRAIERSQVAVLLLDATEPGVEQDMKIAALAEDKGRPLIIVVNKWDKVAATKREAKVRDDLKYQLKFVAHSPIIFTSAITGAKVEKVLELARELHGQWHFRAPTPRLNKLLEHITTEHPAPFAHGKAVRLYYAAQVATAPPAFAFMCNMPKEIPDRYKRYITNQLRATFDLKVPIRLFFRERPGKEKRQQRVATMKARRKHR
jgi:GTPase